MSRKIIDVSPVVTLTLNARALLSQSDATQFADELAALVKRHVAPHVQDISWTKLRIDPLEIDVNYEHDARCEHCNSVWTEDSNDYNGGCCALDEANDPVRMAELRKLIETVEGGDFYDLDENGRAGRTVISWPNTLASAADLWITAGRSADGVAALLPLIKRVTGRDWCTKWEDPGPDGCSLARLPDRTDRARDPEFLADGLMSLIDDMGLADADKKVSA